MYLAIYGAGGLGREILDLANQINDSSPRWKECFFVVDREYYDPDNNIINELSVYSFESVINDYDNNEVEFIIAQGEPAIRKQLKEKVEMNNYSLTTLIHPGVYIPESTKIGNGVIIQRQCSISSNMTIKDNALIQGNAIFGHDVTIGYNSVVSGLCQLAGNVVLGNESYIGINSCVKEKTVIGNNSIIGMGSAVFRDIEDNVIALGNPARVMKKNNENKVFK